MAGLGERIRDQIRGYWYGTTMLAIGLFLYLVYLIAAAEPPNGSVVVLIGLIATMFGELRYERPVGRDRLPLWVEVVLLAVATGLGASLTLIAGQPLVSLNVLAWPAIFVVGVALRGLNRLIYRAPTGPN